MQISTVDIIQGASFSVDAKGFADKIRLHVSGIDTTHEGWRADVVNFLAGQGYYWNAPHKRAAGTVVSRISGEPFTMGKADVFVNVEYGPAEKQGGGVAFKISISGSSGSYTYNTDASLNLIVVEYNDPDGNDLTDNVPLTVISPNTIITYEWISQTPPLGLSKKYRRKLNKSSWNGEAAGTWLCRCFDAVSLQNLTYWQYTASFEFNPGPDGKGGWKQLAIFRDKSTGQVPPDIGPIVRPPVAPGSGFDWFDVYQDEDFNALNLPQIG